MSRVKPQILGLLFGAIVLLIVPGTVHADLDMKRVSVTGVADGLVSASYRMSVTSVPIGGAMGVCPSGAVTGLGFWSIYGPMKVPTRLMVDKNAIDTLYVDLSWTGQSSLFEIYRSTSPIDLVSPGNLYKTTGLCDDTDENVEPFDVLYFRVIIPPTAEQ